jgi:hypothetical protein
MRKPIIFALICAMMFCFTVPASAAAHSASDLPPAPTAYFTTYCDTERTGFAKVGDIATFTIEMRNKSEEPLRVFPAVRMGTGLELIHGSSILFNTQHPEGIAIDYGYDEYGKIAFGAYTLESHGDAMTISYKLKVTEDTALLHDLAKYRHSYHELRVINSAHFYDMAGMLQVESEGYRKIIFQDAYDNLPDGNMTRADFLVALYRRLPLITANGKPATKMTVEPFFDVDDLSKNAVEAIEFFHSIGVVSGVDCNLFDPNRYINMEEVGVILARLCRAFDLPSHSQNTSQGYHYIYRDGIIYGTNPVDYPELGEMEVARPSDWAYDDIAFVSEHLSVTPSWWYTDVSDNASPILSRDVLNTYILPLFK